MFFIIHFKQLVTLNLSCLFFLFCFLASCRCCQELRIYLPRLSVEIWATPSPNEIKIYIVCLIYGVSCYDVYSIWKQGTAREYTGSQSCRIWRASFHFTLMNFNSLKWTTDWTYDVLSFLTTVSYPLSSNCLCFSVHSFTCFYKLRSVMTIRFLSAAY